MFNKQILLLLLITSMDYNSFMYGQFSHNIVLLCLLPFTVILFSSVLCQIIYFSCYICVMINLDGFCIATNCQNFTVICLFMKVLHSLHKRQRNVGISNLSLSQYRAIKNSYILCSVKLRQMQ